MNIYKIIRKKYNVPHLSEEAAESLITFALGQMSNSEYNYENWMVGTSDKEKKFTDKKGFCYNTESEIMASDTKKYFVEAKFMVEDKHSVEGTFIYLVRMT